MHPPISKEISDLLHQFQDIFQALSSFPPQRDCDHQIPLKPGSKPYRMYHSQKNSFEMLIKEMLQNKDIRPSKAHIPNELCW
jgi:hypothetical protein